MVGFGRTKRVTDPLDDRVKARIVGRDPVEPFCFSSGSEHSAQAEDDVTSPSLSDLVFGFLADDAGGQSPENDSDSERDSSIYDSTEMIDEIINPILHNNSDLFRHVLSAQVLKAIETFSCLKSNKNILLRKVMQCLRDSGYNAAICKTKWESSGGLTAGNYEFIDVIRLDSSNRQIRYYIDTDFASEFEIARPTKQYERLLQSLPGVFVGRSEDLKPILRVMSDAAKRSLKSRDLHLPPWRKSRFMQNKWLGPYRRTANLLPANSSAFLPTNEPTFAVKCRSIGFDAAAVSGRLFFPATTRTR